MRSGNLWLREVVIAAVVAVLVFVLTAVPAFAIVAAVVTVVAPHWVTARQRRQQQHRLRSAWPAVIDDAVSALRAGIAADRALIDALQRLPEPACTAARALAADVRVTGRVDDCFEWFGRTLDDPVADRLLIVIRLTRHLGSPDAVRMLEQLADSARDELMLHESIEARRSWINASAIMATAAPWIIAVGLSTRESARVAYSSSVGTLVLLTAAICSGAAYMVMVRIARVMTPTRLTVRP